MIEIFDLCKLHFDEALLENLKDARFEGKIEEEEVILRRTQTEIISPPSQQSIAC